MTDADALRRSPPTALYLITSGTLSHPMRAIQRLTGRPPTYAGAVTWPLAYGATFASRQSHFLTAGGSPGWGNRWTELATSNLRCSGRHAARCWRCRRCRRCSFGAYWHGRAGADLARTRVVNARPVEHIGFDEASWSS